MEFFLQWLMIATLILVAAAAPGPDFVMTVRNSLVYSRKTGIITALGLGLGVCIHVTYCIIGIAAVIAHSIILFNVIKYIGAAYLIYVGIKALRSKGFNAPQDDAALERKDITWRKALAMGFITNLFNPKATMFYFALFTQVIAPETPVAHQIIFGATSVVIISAWFSFVAFVLTGERLRNKFLSFSQWIDRACGGAMIALGLRLALTRGSAHA